MPDQLRHTTFSTVLVVALAFPSVALAESTRPPIPSPSPTNAAPERTASPPKADPSSIGGAVPDDKEGEPRLSLPTIADRDAWLRSGFRMGLGVSYGDLVGLGGAPSGRLLGFLVRLGVRLDRDWSIVASLQYARAQSAGGLDGLRYSGTIDPTWHVTPHLSMALGLGFGGIVEGSTSRPDISPLGGPLASSYTFPTANPPLPSCSGVGVSALARAEWTIVLGPRSATSLALEAIGQWTGCQDDTGHVDTDSGQAIVRRQWWPQAGGTAVWGITWR